MPPKTAFKAGMYLLETLTSGMYNDPLTIYREYIQNAVDSIDLARKRGPISVKINIDPVNKVILVLLTQFCPETSEWIFPIDDLKITNLVYESLDKTS